MDTHSSHEDIVEVDVGIHTAGKNQEAGGIHDLVGVHARQVPDCIHPFSSDEKVLLDHMGTHHHPTAPDEDGSAICGRC